MPLLMFPEAQAQKITPTGQLTDRRGFYRQWGVVTYSQIRQGPLRMDAEGI